MNGIYTTLGAGLIDDLTMTYQPGTNKLSTVTDNGKLGFKQYGFNQLSGCGGSLNDYDQAGNLTFDHTKKANITYNYLNLPSAIIFNNGNKIQNVYYANGQNLAATRSTKCMKRYEAQF